MKFKKFIKPFIATAMSAILLFSTAPISVWAGAGDAKLASGTINGVAISSLGEAATALTAFNNDAEKFGSVTLTTEQAAKDDIPPDFVLVNDTDHEVSTVELITGFTPGDDNFDSESGTDYENGGDLADGDIIVVKTDASGGGSDTYYAIVVKINDNSPKSGEMSGVNDLESYIFNVIVPMDLNFALDPFQVSDDIIEAGEGALGSQIAVTNFSFINASEIPVKVNLFLDAEINDEDGGEETGFYETPETISANTGTSEDDLDIAKRAYFAILVAQNVDVTKEDNKYIGTAEYAYGEIGEIQRPFTPSTDDITKASLDVSFALDSATIVDESITPAATAFTFYGNVNYRANWDNENIAVTGSYTLIPLPQFVYDNDITEYSMSGDTATAMLMTAPVRPEADE